jgi:hypothetical protein
MRNKKNTFIIPIGDINSQKAAYQDVYAWDAELEEQMEADSALENGK